MPRFSRTIRLSLVVWALFACHGALATERLTWESCVQEVREKNESYRSAIESLRAAKLQVGIAKGGYLPQVTGLFGYTYSKPSDSDYLASLTLTQNIFAGFQDEASIAQATYYQKQLQESLRLVRAQVGYGLKQAYEGLLFAQSNRQLTQEIIKRRQDNLRLVALQYETGRENKGSLLLSQAYEAQARYDDLQAALSINVARSQLNAVLGRERDLDVELVDGIPETLPDSSPDFDRLVQETPQLRMAIAKKDSSREGVKASKSTFFPKLNFTGKVLRESPTFFPENTNWSLGATLSFPFFNGMKDYYSLKSSQAAYLAGAHDEQSARLNLLPSLRQAHSNFVQSIEKLKVDETFMLASKARAEIARSKYNNGLLSFEDWDIIENDLIARQKNFLQSKRDRVLSEAAWQQAKGQGVFE